MWLLDYIEKQVYKSFKEQLSQVLIDSGNRKIAIWGAGVRGIIAGIVLNELGVKDFVYIDSDREKQGKSGFRHYL